MKSIIFLLAAAFVSSAYANEGVYSCSDGGGRGRTQLLITVDDDPGVSDPEVHVLEKSHKTGDFRGWTFVGKAPVGLAIENGSKNWSFTDRKEVKWEKVPVDECFVPVTTSHYSLNGDGDRLEVTNIRDYQIRPTPKCLKEKPLRLEPGRAFYKCAPTAVID